MFSISLWDRKNSSLYLIRDRVGKKPLYFSFIKNTLTFASEIKAIVSNKKKSLKYRFQFNKRVLQTRIYSWEQHNL